MTTELSHSEVETAWLAGLLEGEGYFGVRKMTHRYAVTVELNMTDLDVVKKAQRIMLTSTLIICSKSRHKKIYRAVVCGDVALSLMRRILPHMGERRSKRIEEIISIYESQPPRYSKYVMRNK